MLKKFFAFSVLVVALACVAVTLSACGNKQPTTQSRLEAFMSQMGDKVGINDIEWGKNYAAKNAFKLADFETDVYSIDPAAPTGWVGYIPKDASSPVSRMHFLKAVYNEYVPLLVNGAKVNRQEIDGNPDPTLQTAYEFEIYYITDNNFLTAAKQGEIEYSVIYFKDGREPMRSKITFAVNGNFVMIGGQAAGTLAAFYSVAV